MTSVDFTDDDDDMSQIGSSIYQTKRLGNNDEVGKISIVDNYMRLWKGRESSKKEPEQKKSEERIKKDAKSKKDQKDNKDGKGNDNKGSDIKDSKYNKDNKDNKKVGKKEEKSKWLHLYEKKKKAEEEKKGGKKGLDLSPDWSVGARKAVSILIFFFFFLPLPLYSCT